MIDLLKKRQRIDQRILQVQSIMTHLESLCSELDTKISDEWKKKQEVKLGLTEAVKKALQEPIPIPITAVEVKQRMESSGFDFNKYSNPLAAIHNVLKRLVVSGQVKAEVQPNKKKKYLWLTPVLQLLEALQLMLKASSSPGGAKS
jgi:hypothetical protein